MTMTKSLIIASRWVVIGAPLVAGDVVTQTRKDDQELRVRIIEFPGHYNEAMDAACACGIYKGRAPLLYPHETLCNTIPVPS